MNCPIPEPSRDRRAGWLASVARLEPGDWLIESMPRSVCGAAGLAPIPRLRHLTAMPHLNGRARGGSIDEYERVPI
jgi:hypothetical protein